MSSINTYVRERDRAIPPSGSRGLVQLSAADFGGSNGGGSDQDYWNQLVQAASDCVKQARTLNADWPPDTLEQADYWLDQALGKATPPAPDEEDWTQLLSGATGLAGEHKWTYRLTGINPNGCDIFVPRQTVVRAPYRSAVYFRMVPGGPMPIGEMILVYLDGRAVRFRHVTALITSGLVDKGAAVARVYDPSMDMLRWPSRDAFNTPLPRPPDGYQHLDISLASSTNALDPTGGAGGDVYAYGHIWGKMGGIPRIAIIPRTPGPSEGMA